MKPEVRWPRNDYSRVPFRLHHDEELYALEMERIFRGPAWSYLCLEAEIPKPCDFRTTWVGDTPVIMMTDTILPGLGTFTVRVFFHGDRYGGTWQHGAVGGHMSGRIEKRGATDR